MVSYLDSIPQMDGGGPPLPLHALLCPSPLHFFAVNTLVNLVIYLARTAAFPVFSLDSCHDPSGLARGSCRERRVSSVRTTALGFDRARGNYVFTFRGLRRRLHLHSRWRLGPTPRYPAEPPRCYS